MREEKERGASLAQQIRNGFNRAWVTIFDSHVTNFLAAIVLYIVGTEEVKGFALTMIIGMAWNLFTAVFMSRVIFEFFYAKGWLKNVTMLKLMDKSNFDFIGPRHYCMAGSLVVIVLGLIATFARGQGMFNIDFTGGTLVTIRLNDNDPAVKPLSESQRAQLVRQKASVLPDVTVESLRLTDDKRLARFNIRTTEEKLEKVKTAVLQSFGSALAHVEMAFGEGKPIAAVPAASGDAAKGQTVAAPRFAGGHEYELSLNTTAFNSTQTPAQVVSAILARVLEKAAIPNPASRFEIAGSADLTPVPGAGTKLALRTDLEPDVAKKELEQLKQGAFG